MRRSLWLGLLAGLLLSILAGIALIHSHGGPEAPPPPSYVGQAICGQCHQSEAKAWEGSHHAKSMQAASEATVLGDFNDASLTVQGLTSRFFKRDGKFFVQTEGPDGAMQDFPIAYSFGLYPLQQYLVPFPGGKLQALSLAWDSRPKAQGGQHWFSLYPDERIKAGDPLHWTGRNQTWNFMCADCHSTGLVKGYDLKSDSYQTHWSDVDVACESCHGPASAHVAWAKQGSPNDQSKGFALSLKESAKGQWQAPDERGIRHWGGEPRANKAEEVCAGCHSRRRALTDGVDHSKPFLSSYVPSLLGEGLYRADGQIEDEVFEYGSFQQSKMHGAGVTCTDCHEPHGGKLRAEGNALCGQCHDAARFDSTQHHHHKPGEAGAECVSCHMPSRTYMQVHSRRDHSFRLPRPDLSQTIGVPNACTQCHSGKSDGWASQTLTGWGVKSLGTPHSGTVIWKGRTGAAGGDGELSAVAQDSAVAPIIRGTALELLARWPGSTALQAIVVGLRDSDPLVRLGAVRALDPYKPDLRRQLATALLTDPVLAVRIEAARQLAGVKTWSPELAASEQAGLAAWEATELASAERPETHLNLGALRLEQGKPAEVEAAFRTALALDPKFVPALLNLADLYRATNREAEAEQPLRQAVAASPDDADAHYALGLWLVRQKRLPEALTALGRAMVLHPEDPRYRQAYELVKQQR